MTQSGSQRQEWVVCILLALTTLAVYWPATHYGFVRYDDPDYVTDNKDVQQGLNLKSIEWAFTTDHAANWHPLTNLLFHTANSVLLLLLLCRVTGALWPSAFVAAIFALHPLHVESVAWVA